MKKLVVLSSLLLIVVLLLAGTGCATTTSNSSTSGNGVNVNPSFLREGTLEGKIMDAVTGEPIGGDDLKMYLIDGKDIVKPDKLVKDLEDELVGSYAFTSIPVGLYDANYNELNFRLVVIHPDYQQFESIVCLSAILVEGYSYDNDQIDNTFTNEEFHSIGNIYLYPLGSPTGDVIISVRDPQGRPVNGASVLLQQNVDDNSVTADTSSLYYRLYAAPGMYPSLTDETDSDGNVGFSSADLVLGGNYNVVVEPLTSEGQELAMATPVSFTIGKDTVTRVIHMAVAADSTSNLFTLVATSASNQLPSAISADGSLTIKFNQPVIVDTTKFTVSLSTGGLGVLASPTPSAILSADNMTLTLTPAFSTLPTAKGATVTYGYSDIVRLKNAQTGATFGLFGTFWWLENVNNINTGDLVSGTVQMISY